MSIRTFVPTLALGALLLAGCETTPAVPSYNANDGRVSVTYSSPEKFTDAGDSFSPGATDQVMRELTRCLQEEVRRYLPAGEKFSVTITDIDRAGEITPRSRTGMHDLRVVRSAFPPRIDLSYQLTDASGKVIAEGKEQLTDLAFHMASSFDIRDDALYYEKNLLKKWVRSLFQS